ncbi:MAG: SCO family protein [Vulcanimicrobiaceae bacterium]
MQELPGLLMHRRVMAALILTAIVTLGLPRLADAAPEARLQDQAGHAFTFPALRGEPLVVTFVAAHCTDACPLINGQFAIAQREIIGKRLRVRLLTITLDPEHDPPATMRHLAHVFGADPHHWLVASGDLADVHAVMRAFNVAPERDARGYADVHTTFVYLLDSHGRLRKTMLASFDLGTQLVATLRDNWRVLAT